MSAIRHKGIVKWFNKQMGFGFIAVAPTLKLQLGIPADRDLYVHAENLVMTFPRMLTQEQKVSFAVEQGSRGPRAINVEVLA